MKTYQQFMEKLIMNYRPQSGAGGANARKSREHQLKATAKHDERLKAQREGSAEE